MDIKVTEIRNYIYLHVIFIFYSINGIISKMASKTAFLSPRFLLFYGLLLFNLFVYAILWQNALKIMPLSKAYSNKAVTTIWGIVWGSLFFNEKITLQMIIGAFIIIGGILMVVYDDE